MLAETKNFLRRTLPVAIAIGLVYLASLGEGMVSPTLPETGGSMAFPAMSGNGTQPLESFGVVDLGKVKIPLKKSDECPLLLPPGIVVSCHSLPLKDGSGQLEIGPLIIAHNVTYIAPGAPELPNFRGLNPGGEIMRHQRECVIFGKLGPMNIGVFERVTRHMAGLVHTFSRLMTSAEPSTNTSWDLTVYEAPLTPCDEEPPVAMFTTYTVRPGDSFIKIAKILGVTPQQLATANNRKLDEIITIGEVLIAP